jgi:hypothetical protein
MPLMTLVTISFSVSLFSSDVPSRGSEFSQHFIDFGLQDSLDLYRRMPPAQPGC